MKKQVKIIVGLILSAVLIMTLIGCPSSSDAADDAGGGGGSTNNFKGKEYGVRIETDLRYGVRYYEFHDATNLTISEETRLIANQNRAQSRSTANQSDIEYFRAYKGPYITEGTEVSWKTMTGDPVTANFDFKADGSYSVETTVKDKDTGNTVGTSETLPSDKNVDATVDVPNPPLDMYTDAHLIGTWKSTVVNPYNTQETYTSYMEFTDKEIIFCELITYNGQQTFIVGGKETYIAQFGRDKKNQPNKNVAVLKLASQDLNNKDSKTFDVFMTFTNADNFTIMEEIIDIDENGNETPSSSYDTMNFTKYTSSFPTPTTSGLTKNDLHGNWKTTWDYGDGDSGEETYTITANTLVITTANTLVIGGNLSSYTYTYNITFDEVSGSEITISGYTVNHPFKKTFTFLNGGNKNAVFCDYNYNTYIKQ